MPLPRRLLTWRDYLDTPVGGPRFQLIQGDLHMTPAPNTRHQIISRNIEEILLDWVKETSAGIVLDAPLDAFLTDIDVYQPDIVFVSNNRRAIIEEDGLHCGPDLVVEILSKSTAKFDLGPKKFVYSRTGVKELWIVDPAAKTVTVSRFAAGAIESEIVWGESDVFATGILPGLKVEIARFFAGMDWLP
jgi:Uma2 family endonuclease